MTKFKETIDKLYPEVRSYFFANDEERNIIAKNILDENPGIVQEIENMMKELVFEYYMPKIQGSLIQSLVLKKLKEVLEMPHISDDIKETLKEQYQNLEEKIAIPTDKMNRNETGVPESVKSAHEMPALPLKKQINNVCQLSHEIMIESFFAGLIVGNTMAKEKK